MELYLTRFSSQSQTTLGVLHIQNILDFQCFTLEDRYRAEKIKHETRIPGGRYEIKLRTEGGHHARYLEKYGPDFHKGMLHLQDVPNFTWILIHCGNHKDHTSGCLLLGDNCQQNITEEGRINSSRAAYERVYPIIAKALVDGEQVFINIRDIAL